MTGDKAKDVTAGPYGHWYAWHGGELVAVPITAGEDAPPTHPADLPDDDAIFRAGWYAPDDLQGQERQDVLTALLAEDVNADG